MLRLTYDNNWPEIWKASHAYDEVEVWGSRRNLGHSNQYRSRRNWAIGKVEELILTGVEIRDVAGGAR